MEFNKSIFVLKTLFDKILTKNRNVCNLFTNACKLVDNGADCQKKDISTGESNFNTEEIAKQKRISVAVGDKVTEMRCVSQEDVDKFADVTGDHNPIHKINEAGGKSIVHGALLNGLVSGVIGTKLPGPGTLVVSQTLNFPNPCYAGEDVKIVVEIESVRKIISCTFFCTVCRQQEITVLQGNAKLIPMKNFSN
ncbi:hypothetical protein L9F63_002053 [Diploptera punctata]|uniref:MaoC-like domain-containing protein n=1 Tax=Diploptera punctata TaxID=6984 RepID=A0AAD8EJ39_DIPPU|nr:hypothetical protein L9F63_002053 [Diploptera punctata]